MAKKIIISFNSLPILGEAFSYFIKIEGEKILYNSGVDEVNTYFKSQLTDPIPPQSIQLRNSIENCIAETIFTLNTYFVNNIITYNVIGTTIEVLINSDVATIEYINQTNSSISISDETIVTTSKLKYFLEYKNIIGDIYRCQISQKDFTGNTQQVYGKISIEKGSVKDHLDPIRGTGLSLSLEASKDISLEDLYTQDEQEFTVKLYKNNKIYFVGYLKPDGVFQDYTRDEWVINLDCVDGLGSLKNLSFVKESGLVFTGKMNGIDLIYNCLKRSGILLNINTSVNTLYDGLVASDNLDVLAKTYFNTDRFVKTDNNTIMSCEDVLKSVLDIFCAVITQKDGEWYVYKPNELYINTYPLFRRYDLTNTFIGTKKLNLNSKLGSQIDNFYPHHSGSNQRIEIKGGVSAFRVGYKYGLVNGILPNGKLLKTGTDYDLWTKNPLAAGFFINDPLRESGLSIKVQKLTDPNALLLLTSTPISVSQDYVFDFKTSLSITGANVLFGFKVVLGSFYLKNDGTWTNDSNTFINNIVGSNDFADVFTDASGDFSLQSTPTPIAGLLTVQIYRPSNFLPLLDDSALPIATINSLDISSGSEEIKIRQGEFHTVQRSSKISTIVKENKEVFNGDESNNFYIGSLFKEDKTETTTLWFRKGFVENKQLLRIAAEEELRISQKPTRIFSGSVYGYLEYINIIKINNINCIFMPIEWKYDTISNISTIKSLELFVAEIGDIDYKFTYDFGETVKPTITG